MEHKPLGKNQSYNRKRNNRLVLESLLKDGPQSATSLARRFGLSNAALSGILKSLANLGIIKEDKRSSLSGKGRKQVEFALDEHYGFIAIVALANYQAKVVLSNVRNEVLASSIEEVPQYDAKAIYEIVLQIYRLLLENHLEGEKLREIVISWPGRVNASTGELAGGPQFDPALFKDKDFIIHEFSKQFPSAAVSLGNDVKFALLGEQEEGALKEEKNAMLLSLDTGIGGAFLFDGKPFKGDQGYAGEFGLLVTEWKGKNECIDEFLSLRALKNRFRGTSSSYHTKDLLMDYEQNPAIHQEIVNSAFALGKALAPIVSLLDVSTIVLSGRVSSFGEDYLNAVRKGLEESFTKPSLSFSRLGEEATLIGAIHYGVAEVLYRAIETKE